MSDSHREKNPFAAPESAGEPAARFVSDAEVQLTAVDWVMAIISALFVLILGELAALWSSVLFQMMGLPPTISGLLSIFFMLIVPVLAGFNIWMSLRKAKAKKRRKLSMQQPADA